MDGSRVMYLWYIYLILIFFNYLYICLRHQRMRSGG